VETELIAPCPGSILITGGAHGIGKEIAHEMGRNGWPIIIVDRDLTAAQEAARILESEGARARGIGADVCKADDMASAVEVAEDTFGSLYGLVNCAAVFATVKVSRSPFDMISEEEWDLVMDVNVKGTWLACRAAVPIMRRAGRGRIVNISSGVAFKGTPNFIHYVTSKAGIIGFTRALARELGSDGIRVNCVAPGRTLSEDSGTFDADRADPGISDRCIQRVELPSDVVGAVRFLLSDLSDFITGQTIVVDGGSYLH